MLQKQYNNVPVCVTMTDFLNIQRDRIGGTPNSHLYFVFYFKQFIFLSTYSKQCYAIFCLKIF